MHEIDTIDRPANTSGPAWIQARARLTLYLEALELPETDASRLLELALTRARAQDPAAPLASAMSALQELLTQHLETPPPAMRPLRRGPMVPAPLDRSLLRFLLDDLPAWLTTSSLNLLSGLRRWPRLLSAMAALALVVGYQQIG